MAFSAKSKLASNLNRVSQGKLNTENRHFLTCENNPNNNNKEDNIRLLLRI